MLLPWSGHRKQTLGLSLLWGSFLGWYPALACSSFATGIISCAVLGCFAAAAIMDSRELCVYRYVWYPAVCCSLVLFFLKSREAGIFCTGVHYLPERYFAGLLLYVFLQEALFAKFYGRADCHGFVVAGVFHYCLGGTFRDCIVHMGITFLELLVVQLCKGNVNCKGNLKRPVPLLPYMVTALQLQLLASG